MPAMTLAELLKTSPSLAAVAAHLDALDTEALRAQALTLDRSSQRRLYDLASNEIGLDHFATSTAPVTHAGRNTLPLPPPFKSFAKVFARPEDGSDRLFGFNESPSRPLIGPGYFVAYATAGNPAWQARGGVVVDYFQVPDGPVPDGWPKVVPNSHGLQYFVYRHTRDFMRRVSGRVSIGAAYKVEKALDHYFVLVSGA